MRPNKALDFDGVGGSVTVSDASSIQNIFDGGGTIECWIKARSDGEADYGRIVNKLYQFRVQGEAAGKVKIGFYVFFSGDNGYWISTATEIALNTWAHIVLTYNSGAVENNPIIYVNGTSVALTESSTPTGNRTTDAGQDLIIGNDAGDAFTFDGTIDEPRLYRRILGQAEITHNYNGGAGTLQPYSTRDIVAWWHMDEGAGSKIYDETGHNNTGIMAGTSATETLRPNAAGDEENITWSTSGAGNHWQDVDEEIADDPTTTVRTASATYERDLYNLPTCPDETINFIKIYFRCRASIAAVIGYAKPSLKSNGIATDGNEVEINTAWTTYSQQWNTNPADGQAWEKADIDSLQIGVSLKQLTGELSYCTQIYVEVNYTPIIGVTWVAGFPFMPVMKVPRRARV